MQIHQKQSLSTLSESHFETSEREGERGHVGNVRQASSAVRPEATKVSQAMVVHAGVAHS
jgi:hypothetical protein